MIDPVDDTRLMKKARDAGIPLNANGTNEVFTWKRYLRVMNTISSRPMFKRLQLKVDESSREEWKNTKHGVIAGPFETMTDVWERLSAFEKKWEEDTEWEDHHANTLKAVEDKVAKSTNLLMTEQAALKKELAEARGSAKDRRSLNAIANELLKRGEDTLQPGATDPCLLCGATDCVLCDWCGEACSGQNHDRSKCSGAKKHEAGDTCFRCFKPRNSKNFQKPTKKHRHRPDQCRTCPRKVRIKLRLVKKGQEGKKQETF